MPKSSSRGSRIAVGVATLVGAALALPTIAAAEDVAPVVVDAVTAVAHGEHTAVTLTLPDGFNSCAGPVVVTGKLSVTAAQEWDFGAAAPVPAGHELVHPTDLAEIGGVDTADGNTSLTVTLPLGSAEHTAVARCEREAGVPITYYRDINHQPGDGAVPSLGSLGSLDFFGSLGPLDALGSLGSVYLQSTGTMGSLGSVTSGS